MTLVEGAHAAEIRGALSVERAVSGGTVVNTAVGTSRRGRCEAGVLARSPTMTSGVHFGADLERSGVRTVLEHPAAAPPGAGTGACYVIVTPDVQRTMVIMLGVSGLLSADFVATSAPIEDAALVYFDGYLLDFPEADGIVASLLSRARAVGTRVAFGLADPYAVGPTPRKDARARLRGGRLSFDVEGRRRWRSASGVGLRRRGRLPRAPPPRRGRDSWPRGGARLHTRWGGWVGERGSQASEVADVTGAG